MAKQNKRKRGDEIRSLTKEELQNMKFRLSIQVPKEDFEKLLTEMLGGEQNE